MSEPITFASVEQQVREYLTGAVQQDVVVKIPSMRPAEFVRLMLTGSTRRNLVTLDARVTIECWAERAERAESIARDVYARMSALDLPDGTHVPDGEDGWVGGPYADEDPISGTPRYVMTAVVRQPAVVL